VDRATWNCRYETSEWTEDPDALLAAALGGLGPGGRLRVAGPAAVAER
jgi:hypothetical protein